MQNRWHSSDEAGYVALNGGWRCNRCGCWNAGCDVCRQCGWNRCGCQGGVVAAQDRPADCGAAAQTTCPCQAEYACAAAAETTRGACGCTVTTGRQSTCQTCPPDRVTGHSVQCCPANTTTRSTAAAADAGACGCTAAAQENRCGCAVETACQRAAECMCGCTAPAQENRCGCAVETACQRAAERMCGCTAAAQENRCGCAYAANAGARSAECPEAAGVGMVYAVDQTLGDVYQSESALRTGTLFPELHKPLNGRCPGSCNCSTTGQQSAFAAWDLRLYLDTHPEDQQALNFFAQLAREAEDPNYATAFLTGGPFWTWTDEPWPWECRPCNAQ